MALQAVAADSSRRAAEKAAAHEVLILALAQQHASHSQKEKKSKKKTKSHTKKHASNHDKATLNNSAAVQHQAPIQTEADPVLADDSDEGR